VAEGVQDLTEREREVLRLLLAGHTAKSAASELDLSVHTINDYLREARKKLGVSSSREAARILGDKESAAPQKSAPEQTGMGETAPLGDHAKPSATPGPRSYRPWIIGAFAMLAALIAATLAFTASTPSDPIAPGQVASEKGEETMENVVQENVVATEAARNWVRLIDAGEYTESWSEAGSMFKQAVTADSWAAQVAPIREPLGSLVSRTEKSIEARSDLPGAPAGDYRMISFDTAYSASPERVETVVMHKENGRWSVVGYFIR